MQDAKQDANSECTTQSEYEKAVGLLEHNPLLRQPALTVLRIAQQQPATARQLVEVAATNELIDQSLFQPIHVIVDALIRNGALDETVLVDGKPYPDGFQGLLTNNTISAEAQVERLITITKAGIGLLAAYGGQDRLAEFLDREPSLRNIHLGILHRCREEAGCTRFELEELIDSLVSKEAHAGAAHAKVYPQYFLDSLEAAGGIIWKQSWRTTEAGEAVITLRK